MHALTPQAELERPGGTQEMCVSLSAIHDLPADPNYSRVELVPAAATASTPVTNQAIQTVQAAPRPERPMSKKSKTHHVVPDPKGGWNVKKGGAQRASKHFDTKQDAVKWGRFVSIKQGTRFVIHRKDGTIQR